MWTNSMSMAGVRAFARACVRVGLCWGRGESRKMRNGCSFFLNETRRRVIKARCFNPGFAGIISLRFLYSAHAELKKRGDEKYAIVPELLNPPILFAHTRRKLYWTPYTLAYGAFVRWNGSQHGVRIWIWADGFCSVIHGTSRERADLTPSEIWQYMAGF